MIAGRSWLGIGLLWGATFWLLAAASYAEPGPLAGPACRETSLEGGKKSAAQGAVCAAKVFTREERVLVRWLGGRASPKALEAYRMRIFARGVLIRKGPRIVPLVMGLLRDPRLLVRISAVQILGALRDTRAIPALISLAQGRSNFFETRFVAHALGVIGDKAGASTCRRLLRHSGDKETRRRALWALGRTGGAADAAMIEPFLTKPALAAAAVEALIRLGNKASYPILARFLRTTRQPEMVSFGLVAAARLDGARAVSLVQDAWARPGIDRKVVLEAFGATHSYLALPYLLAALRREIPTPAGPSGQRLCTVWQRIALVSLGELGKPQALEPLQAFLRGKEPIGLRVLCLATLFRLTGDVTYLPLLSKLGVRGPEAARRSAISILSATGNRACAPVLRRWIRHGSCWAVAEAISALEKIEDRPYGSYAGLARSKCSHLSHSDLTVAGDFWDRLRREARRGQRGPR